MALLQCRESLPARAAYTVCDSVGFFFCVPGEGNFKHKNEAPGVKCVRMEVTAGHAGFVFVLVVLVHGFWTFFIGFNWNRK